MDECALFGEVYSSNRRGSNKTLAVRKYRGVEVPWEIHDCSESNRCSFCKIAKHKFAKAFASSGEGK